MVQSDTAFLSAFVASAAPPLLTPSPTPRIVHPGGELSAGYLLVHAPAPALDLGVHVAGRTLARVTPRLAQMRGGGGSAAPDPGTHSLAHGHGGSAGGPWIRSPGHQRLDRGFPAWTVSDKFR